MYIIKNALRCIGRSKGRNILIGIIALVIAVSACIGLSIRQAAESAKSAALDGMSVTATIDYDRNKAMQDIVGGRPSGGSGGSGRPSMNFDKNAFSNMMGGSQSLTLDEYKKYAEAESVEDFYYTLNAYFNGSENFSAVSDEVEDESTESTESSDSTESSNDYPGQGRPMMPGGFGGGKDNLRGASGDFSIIGYSSDSAMTSFVNGNASILDGGVMFDEGTSERVCVISEELAIYNNLVVGDTIVISNPAAESETYTLTISGIYTSTENNGYSSFMGKSQDPANQIYMSATALQSIIDESASKSTTVTDDNGRTSETKVTGTLSAIYSFANTDDYYAFESEARALGLSDSYAISSSDISAFESSIAPLNTLSTMAGWFLLVILIIGGVILVVLNIFNVRERKYEVGVLTAMGMKKWKVAAQFICEILVVTMIAVIIGAGVGAVSSVPVTNALLAGQVESQSNQQNQMDENFGRPGNAQGGMGGFPSNMPSNIPNGFGGDNPFGNMFGSAASYITEVDSAMNLTVVFQMLGVGLLLTLIASAASVLFIMRYDPLKILANRD